MALESNLAELLNEYEQSHARYQEFKDYLVRRIAELLHASDVKCHDISGRLKSKSSLAGKISSGKRVYASLLEITDIAGIRVTTYFARDVDRVAEILNPFFVIDSANSIDKRASIDPDRFGYVSLHFVVSMRESGSNPSRKFANLKGEIQIRSILQHAWAAIEHDLGYKSQHGVPRIVRRRFAMVAGLLELADRQFDELREEIREYVGHLPAVADDDVYSVEIDSHSMQYFVETDHLLREVDSELSQLINVPIGGKVPLRRLLIFAKLLNISKIQQLRRKLAEERTRLVEFAEEWFENGYSGHTVALASGTAIIFLFYLHVSSDADMSRAISLLSESGISEKLVEEAASRILSVQAGL